MKQPQKILVPTDFSAASLEATNLAIELAKFFKARLHLLHVIELDSFQMMYGQALISYEDTTRRIQEAAEEQMKSLKKTLMKETDLPIDYEIRTGVSADLICEYAHDHQIDWIVMATHGRKGFNRFLLGSVAERVVRSAPCPVMTIHGPK